MFHQLFYTLWGVMFVLCAALGFIPEPQGAARIALTGLSVLFFLPPAVLVWQARKAGDRRTLRLIRNLSLLSLGVTLVMLIVVVLTIPASLAVGDILYGVLTVLSAPMIGSQIWMVSLCLWAVLLWTCIAMLRKLK